MTTQPTTFVRLASAPGAAIPASVEPTVRRFSVDEYHRMSNSGILTENDQVQLVNGWIVAIPPIGPEHSTSTSLIAAAIEGSLPAGWIVRRQDPITLATGEPEPDVVVARGTIRDYSRRHPGANDVALVVEVADATLNFDRVEKLLEYAAAGIVEYWIVNLVHRQIEVYRDPYVTAAGPEYRQREVRDAADTISLMIDGQEVAQFGVADLLP
jgi:Uma2 family endonuclease